jgi:hypothetical protein
MNRVRLRFLSLCALVAAALPVAVFAPGAATAQVITVRTVAHQAPAAVDGEVVLGLPSPAAKMRGAALSWSASTDNVAVSGYTVLRSSTGAAGSYVQTATSRTAAYTDGTLTSGRTYYYELAAYDAAGNRSAPSKVVTVKAR